MATTREQVVDIVLNDPIRTPWTGTANSIVVHNSASHQMELYGPTASHGWTRLNDLGITPDEAANLGMTTSGRNRLGLLGDKTAALYASL